MPDPASPSTGRSVKEICGKIFLGGVLQKSYQDGIPDWIGQRLLIKNVFLPPSAPYCKA
jgi:hypothetical protein